MGYRQRLDRWVEAGLLEQAQATCIVEFERGSERPLLLYAVAGLGGLAIAIGLVSIIAANWDLIPAQVKLTNDVLMMLALGTLYGRYEKRWPLWASEVLLLVLYGLTMGSIALIGQVYQLGGTAREAMLAWSLLTAPLMVLGRTGFTGAVWSLGLQATMGVWLSWLGEYPREHAGWALAGAGLVPWPWLLLGQSRWLIAKRPAYAAVCSVLGWVELVLCASIGANAFYGDTRNESWNAMWLGLGLGAVAAAFLWRVLGATSAGKTARWLPAVALLLTFVPAWVSPGDWDIAAALAFIALWLMVAFSAHRAGLLTILNLSTAVVGIRIVIVYFEVFGSLLSTGVGLVTGGMLTLALVWFWWDKRRDFRAELSSTKERAS